MSMTTHTTTETVYWLAAEAHVDPRTARRWLADPTSVRPALRERLEAAALAHGIGGPIATKTAKRGKP